MVIIDTAYTPRVQRVNMICVATADTVGGMSTPQERLRQARLRANYSSARQAAAALGVKPSTYAAHENGQNSFGVEEAKQYAAKFKVRWEWLLDNEGPQLEELEYVRDDPRAIVTLDGVQKFTPGSAGGIPELDVRAGAGEGAIETTYPTYALGNGGTYRGHEVVGEWSFPPAYLRQELKARPGKTVVMEVQGDSMMPTLSPGDRVIVDLTQNRLGPDGAIYLISYDEGDPQVKRLQTTEDDDRKIRILSDNSSVRDRLISYDRLIIYGRIIGRVTRL
jgi:phage repressor protein C with HTH and peptisase S24 domain